MRLTSIAAHIERQIRHGNPAFTVHREERHAEGYREDVHYILTHRDVLLG